MPLIPTPFLFHFTLPVARVDRLPKAKAPLLKLPKTATVPFPSAMDQTANFATLQLAWNQRGFCVIVNVTGKTDPTIAHANDPFRGDHVRIWIDTRDTQTVHRATRFCHSFLMIPVGHEDDPSLPMVRQYPIGRANEDAPLIDVDDILQESEVTKKGYELRTWFPAESLNGYDPDSQSRLGFYISIHDGELGTQYLTVGDEFPFETDPSLWSSLELLP